MLYELLHEAVAALLYKAGSFEMLYEQLREAIRMLEGLTRRNTQ